MTTNAAGRCAAATNVGRDAVSGAVVDTCQPRNCPRRRTCRRRVRHQPRHDSPDSWAAAGTSAPLDAYGVNPPPRLTAGQGHPTRSNRPVRALLREHSPDARRCVEDATWSARRDTETGYGIAVFDLDPDLRAARRPSHSLLPCRRGRSLPTPDSAVPTLCWPARARRQHEAGGFDQPLLCPFRNAAPSHPRAPLRAPPPHGHYIHAR